MACFFVFYLQEETALITLVLSVNAVSFFVFKNCLNAFKTALKSRFLLNNFLSVNMLKTLKRATFFIFRATKLPVPLNLEKFKSKTKSSFLFFNTVRIIIMQIYE